MNTGTSDLSQPMQEKINRHGGHKQGSSGRDDCDPTPISAWPFSCLEGNRMAIYARPPSGGRGRLNLALPGLPAAGAAALNAAELGKIANGTKLRLALPAGLRVG